MKDPRRRLKSSFSFIMLSLSLALFSPTLSPLSIPLSLTIHTHTHTHTHTPLFPSLFSFLFFAMSLFSNASLLSFPTSYTLAPMRPSLSDARTLGTAHRCKIYRESLFFRTKSLKVAPADAAALLVLLHCFARRFHRPCPRARRCIHCVVETHNLSCAIRWRPLRYPTQSPC
jgi:hypothetical protein